MDNNILRIEALTKVYGNGSEKTVALDNVSLQVTRKKLLAVYGPSGSGKTTLLFLLGGLDRPTSGKVYFNETEITTMDEQRLSRLRRDSIGFVFQNYNLVDDLTALENVVLPLMFSGKSETEMRDRAGQLLKRVGVQDKKDRRPSQLSAGEQQRVAVARAIVNRPQLVLMDEPTGNLDQENSKQLMQLITDTIHMEGTTCIIATHNPDIVAGADANIMLKSGKIMTS